MFYLACGNKRAKISMVMNNIGIFGVGAIGSVLAKYLCYNSSNRLFYYNRSKLDGIHIQFKGKNIALSVDIESQGNERLDWLIICLKEYQILEAKESIKGLVSKETKIVVFRNGINLKDDYEELIDDSAVLETVIDCSVIQLDSKSYLQLKKPIITLPESRLSEDFIHLFAKEGVDIVISPNFKNKLWLKLIESSAIGSIQAATNSNCSIFKSQSYVKDCRELIKESILVAQHEGIILNEHTEQILLDKILKYPEKKGSSMLTDKMNSQPLELNAKIGILYETAQRHHLDIPMTSKYYSRLLAYNHNRKTYNDHL